MPLSRRLIGLLKIALPIAAAAAVLTILFR